MKYKDFRNFRITRTCKEEFEDYQKYKPYLAKDFEHRCAYCNTLDSMIEPLYFTIDHYVPRDTFKEIDDTLDYNYNNLMYACPKCNLTKGTKYERK